MHFERIGGEPAAALAVARIYKADSPHVDKFIRLMYYKIKEEKAAPAHGQPRGGRRVPMKRYAVRWRAFVMLAALCVQPALAQGTEVQRQWRAPTAQQARAAAAGRMALPAEEETPPLDENGVNPATQRHRYYTSVQLEAYRINLTYDPMGYATYHNRGTNDVTLEYVQGKTVTTQWEATANMREKPVVRRMVLAKLQAECQEVQNLSIQTSVTLGRSTEGLATMTVSPGKTGTLSAYHSAVEVRGRIGWQEVDQEGTVWATGSEAVGGAFLANGMHYVAEGD